MDIREFSNSDTELLEQDEARAGRKHDQCAGAWVLGPDPFENKCLASETAPSPF